MVLMVPAFAPQIKKRDVLHKTRKIAPTRHKGVGTARANQGPHVNPGEYPARDLHSCGIPIADGGGGGVEITPPKPGP